MALKAHFQSKMNKYAAIILLAFFFLGLTNFVLGEASYSDNRPAANNHPNTLLAELENEARNAAGEIPNETGAGNSNYDKRVERYAFGLGRRAYTYTNGNGVKRLPVYNFGLGKRARPYSFGLGKRSEYDDDQQYDMDMERYLDEKRNRPYSFGLGKRDPMDDIDRRAIPNRYGFGLGR